MYIYVYVQTCTHTYICRLTNTAVQQQYSMDKMRQQQVVKEVKPSYKWTLALQRPFNGKYQHMITHTTMSVWYGVQ